MDTIASLMRRVDQKRLAGSIDYLARDPLPCRRLNYTLPGHAKSTLDEADDFIQAQLESWGYVIEKEAVQVQAFRRDLAKPLAHQYSRPDPSDPWYAAHNLYAKKIGTTQPGEVIVVVAHKDSQSWMDCGPGAHDNAVGTAGVLEIARVLREYAPKRSIWFLFCNEEHTPWTSVTAARNLAESERNVIAVLNLDSIGGKSEEDRRAGRMVNVTRYTTPEGEELADLMAALNERHAIGLAQAKYRCDQPGDDDGSFIKAGIPAAVLNVGSFPYAEPHYHREEDTPETVDVTNVSLATQLSLAAVLHLDAHGT